MNTQLRRLAALRAKRTSDDVYIIRTCRNCGALVPGDPSLTPCAAHPPTPAPQPGERIITVQRSYGIPAAPGQLSRPGFLRS